MKIWKWELEVTDRQTITLPVGARILAVQSQHNAPCLWALVDPAATKEPRTFATQGTGQTVKDDCAAYIGTYQLNGGSLVFHVFEVDA